MKKNDNSSTGAFIISLTFAVVVFTALYIQHKPTVQSELAEASPFEEEVVVEKSNAIEWVEEEVITPELPKVISLHRPMPLPEKHWAPARSLPGTGTSIQPTLQKKMCRMLKNRNEHRIWQTDRIH